MVGPAVIAMVGAAIISSSSVVSVVFPVIISSIVSPIVPSVISSIIALVVALFRMGGRLSIFCVVMFRTKGILEFRI